MKLLGVELQSYAKFDRCFIPLDTGIRLLAGKNNSGKTSILRALSALTALPFAQPTQFSPEIARYARKQNPFPMYEMEIFFAYEDVDKSLLGADLSTWGPFRNSEKRTWSFSFRVFPQSSAIRMSGVSLQLDTTSIPMTEFKEAKLIRLLYDGTGKALRGNSPQVASQGPQLPDGAAHQNFVPEEIFSAFPSLMRTRFVNAHRVVTPNLNLQALDTLRDTADSLAPYLDTILSNERESFERIQKVVTDIFPEFKYVNPQKAQNAVSVTLTRRDTDEKVPLTHCGTGVEQVLALATFVLTSVPGTIVLLDEPHSYLHPSAERQVVDFLFSHTEHRYIIATHSAILINAVPPDRILVLTDSNTVPPPISDHPSVPALLHSLGYRNSDLLFHDRLVLVEGESDQDTLPLMLACNPLVSTAELEKTGFPVMGGEGKLRGTDRQRSILYWERFLTQLGRASVPRIYVFDGGCIQADRELLRKSKAFSAETPGLLRFLLMNEIENYLLVPEAILSAMKEMSQFQGEDFPSPEIGAIKEKIEEILSRNDNQKLYPNGPGDEPLRSIKGSVVLDILFDSFGLRYEKRRVGRLIATKISEKNQPLLKEIWDLFPLEFLPHETGVLLYKRQIVA